MDLNAASGTPAAFATVGGPALEQELSLSSTRHQSESGDTVLLQLLEFKTSLLEVVEELHIRRDAEARFEDQIHKLVSEKQELKWETLSLQHQSETVANQHTESLNSVRKQFQVKIRSIEEEKGKYQVSAEVKEKEINNLKEELKSLQLLKFNSERKTSELEQKLVLQSRSKDSHLNQLGEAEKRFNALSRQCAAVKQAHEKLEQNVDEAMKRHQKLSSANEKQEATIVSLRKELEDVGNKLIKARMSSVRHEKSYNPTGKEQRSQQLQQKLNMETEMNKLLRKENAAVRAEKQQVMRSLQHTQQLLLSQTQTVSRVELELQTQTGHYQALKQEHDVMREKGKATEGKMAQLMESYAASKTSWDKEKAEFLDRIKSEQQERHAVNEAYHELHHKHTELSSQAKVPPQLTSQRRDNMKSLNVASSVEGIRGEETVNEAISSSEARLFGSLQHLASTQTKKPDCLGDTGTATKLVVTGATGGHSTPNQHQQFQFKQPPNPSNLNTCTYTNLSSLCSLSETSSDGSILNKYVNTSERDPEVASHSIHSAASMADEGLLISCERDLITATNPDHKSADESKDLLSEEKGDGGMDKIEQGWKDDGKCTNDREEDEISEKKQLNVQGEDVKEGSFSAETREMLVTHRADRREGSQRSTEDTKQPETETEDRPKGEGTAEAKKRETMWAHGPKTQILAQTTPDTTPVESDTQQVTDFMDSQPPQQAACEPSQSRSPNVSETASDSSLENKDDEIRKEPHTFCSDKKQSVSHGTSPAIAEGQHVFHDDLQTVAQDLPHQVSENPPDEKPSDRSVASTTGELTEALNQSSICSSQSSTAQSNIIINIHKMASAQTQPSNPSDITSHTKQIGEMCNTRVRDDCVLTPVTAQASPQSQEISEQERGQLKSCVIDDDDEPSAYKKREDGPSNVDTFDACKIVQESKEKSHLTDAPVETTTDAVEHDFEVESSSCQEHIKRDGGENAQDGNTRGGADLKLSSHPSPCTDPSPTGSTKRCEQSAEKQMLFDDIHESSQASNKTHKSSFEWGSAQRTPVSSRTPSGVPSLYQFVQGSAMSEQNPGALRGYSSSTIPMFLKCKLNKVPLVISTASDLLNASSASGTAASSRRPLQGEWKTMGETCRETADMESRASLSTGSFPVTSSSVSRMSWQTTSGAPTSAAGQSSESDYELSCSQEREDQQSSFRAQISKIQQFLNTERLRLPKRRKTDN